MAQKILSVGDFVMVKFFNKRIPIAVRMEITNRCPNKCSYCNVWNTKVEEPSKEKIFSIIKQLKKLGTKKISFSGGEPLLRDDIGEIIDYCKGLGISPEMNSCGVLIEKRISQIK
ncbi:MAG: radical SAM protein, partial [Elusimicrobia bacterium]|nr:radical SAM protein [Elusimicrobiota bacterium]